MSTLLLGDRTLGRLLAAGWPAWVGTDGQRIGWAVRDRLFLCSVCAPEVVRMVVLPDVIEGAVASPDRWVVALGQGFVTVDPVRAEACGALLDDEADPVGTRAGCDVGVFLEPGGHRALRLSDGQPVAMPDGGGHSRWLSPWAFGEGVAWVDLDTVYRLSSGHIRAIGRSRGTVELCVGPGGALVARGGSASLLAAPRGFGVEGPKVEAVRFSLDGERALVTDAEGASEILLRSGELVQRWAGRLDPVGFVGAEPWVHDRSTGCLRALRSGVVWPGFGGARPERTGEVLVGPGGRRWKLGEDGRDLGLVDGLVSVGSIGGREVIAHVDEELRVYVEGRLEGRRDVGEAERVRVANDRVWVWGDGGARSYNADGELLGGEVAVPGKLAVLDEGVIVAEADEESEVRLGNRSWPVPADGAAGVRGGVWAWSDDGALYALS